MTCDTEKVTHFLNNELSEKERTDFENHLAGCPACQQELEQITALFQAFGKTPLQEPSAQMEARFHGVLHSFKQSLEKPSFWTEVWQNFKQTFIISPRLQTAYGLVLLFVGIAAGYWLSAPAKKDEQEHLAALSERIESMRQVMILTLLENRSSTERLKAVSYTEEAGSVDRQVLHALITTLNGDPNVNVRLATLEALTKFGDNPEVRKQLVESIPKQTSPLVQVALADVMLSLQEKSSIEQLKAVLKNENLTQPVKTKIERTIQKLIL